MDLTISPSCLLAWSISTMAAIFSRAPAEGTHYLVVWLRTAEGRLYRPAAHELERFRGAGEFDWSGEWDELERELLARKPAHLAMVLPPDVIDANLPRQLARTVARFDDDPFLDCRVGFITGATPEDAVDFVRAIIRASGEDLPGRLVRATTADIEESVREGAAPLDGPIDRMILETTLLVGARDPDWPQFVDGNRHELMKAGIIELRHTGVQGMEEFSSEVLFGNRSLFPAIVINASEHAERENAAIAATVEEAPDVLTSRPLTAENLFVLEAIRRGAVAYIGRLTAESPNRTALEEWLILEGNRSLGEVMRVAHDDLVIGALDEDRLRDHLVDAYRDGIVPEEAVALLDDVAHRVLFGDPAFVPFAARLPSTHQHEIAVADGALHVTLAWTELEHDPWVWDRWRADSRVGDQQGRVYERIVLPAGVSLDNDHVPIAAASRLEATAGRDRKDVPARTLVLRERDPDGRSVLHVLLRGPRERMDRRTNPGGPDRLDAFLSIQFWRIPPT